MRQDLTVNERIMNVNIHHSWAYVSAHGIILSLLKNLHFVGDKLQILLLTSFS